VIRQAPQQWGLERSRWWLAGIRHVIGWMRGMSLAGVHQVLRRLKIVYKRGRHSLHSPDPDYAAKLAHIARVWQQVQTQSEPSVLLYEDELSFYRQPTLAQGYARLGSKGPLAVWSHRSNSYQRIAGCLNALTGQVTYWQRSRFDRYTLLNFFKAVEQAYPAAKVIFVVLDNWPVHFHPDLLAGLHNTKIQLLRLPTYAPWTNPVEKLWRKLYQEVLHLHPQANHWEALQQRVNHFLDQFQDASPDLLSYVGLSNGLNY
jgi:DDE superfamily endonuclease